EPRYERIKKGFYKEVFGYSMPVSVTIVLFITLIRSFGHFLGSSDDALATVCVLFMGMCYLMSLYRIYHPLTWYRKLVIYTVQSVWLLAMWVLQVSLELHDLGFRDVLLLLAAVVFCQASTGLFEWIYDKLVNRQWFRKKGSKKKRASG
ncbi:MAG: hypothetical protein IKN57_07785, partial [Parasporobacterium sp.]|nr:hypothetical protein [Parasporobacterium sp.]